MIFDLDGFKGYNDSFGHPAGDALLVRLGEKLAQPSLGGAGAVYRLGGDEFCLVAPIEPGEAELLIDRTCAALVEKGEGFEIGSSFGAVVLPDEATDASGALQTRRRAALRAEAGSRRGDSEPDAWTRFSRRSRRASPTLHAHLEGVGALALEVGKMLGCAADELEELERAAQLHDLGKLAVPDEILHKPGAARRARVGVRPPAHHRGRADPAGLAGVPERRDDRPLEPREMGWHAAIRTGSPARRSRSRSRIVRPATPSRR